MYVSASQRVLVTPAKSSNASDEVSLWLEILWLLHYYGARKKKDTKPDHKYAHIYIYICGVTERATPVSF